jgi:hypothetical protein
MIHNQYGVRLPHDIAPNIKDPSPIRLNEQIGTMADNLTSSFKAFKTVFYSITISS